VAADVPAEVVTVTSTVPADPGGDVAVIWVGESTVNDEAACEPNMTADRRHGLAPEDSL